MQWDSKYAGASHANSPNYSNILDQRIREQGRLNEQKGNN
jgi:hypothetical protein